MSRALYTPITLIHTVSLELWTKPSTRQMVNRILNLDLAWISYVCTILFLFVWALREQTTHTGTVNGANWGIALDEDYAVPLWIIFI